MLTEKLCRKIAFLNEAEKVDCLDNMKADLYSGKIGASTLTEPLFVLRLILDNIRVNTDELLDMVKELERSSAIQ